MYGKLSLFLFFYLSTYLWKLLSFPFVIEMNKAQIPTLERVIELPFSFSSYYLYYLLGFPILLYLFSFFFLVFGSWWWGADIFVFLIPYQLSFFIYETWYQCSRNSSVPASTLICFHGLMLAFFLFLFYIFFREQLVFCRKIRYKVFCATFFVLLLMYLSLISYVLEKEIFFLESTSMYIIFWT